MLPLAEKDNNEIRTKRQAARQRQSDCRDFSVAFINAKCLYDAMQCPNLQEYTPAENSVRRDAATNNCAARLTFGGFTANFRFVANPYETS
jgi:hypothetical protein